MIIEDTGGAALSLSPEMTAQLEEAALEEGCTKSELLHEALRKYLSDRHWRKITSYGQRRARELGITPEDVERLVDEYRSESKQPS